MSGPLGGIFLTHTVYISSVGMTLFVERTCYLSATRLCLSFLFVNITGRRCYQSECAAVETIGSSVQRWRQGSSDRLYCYHCRFSAWSSQGMMSAISTPSLHQSRFPPTYPLTVWRPLLHITIWVAASY